MQCVQSESQCNTISHRSIKLLSTQMICCIIRSCVAEFCPLTCSSSGTSDGQDHSGSDWPFFKSAHYTARLLTPGRPRWSRSPSWSRAVVWHDLERACFQRCKTGRRTEHCRIRRSPLKPLTSLRKNNLCCSFLDLLFASWLNFNWSSISIPKYL